MDRSRQLTPNESDKVARHRNQMHEIALKKQISVFQREGRILQRELREITKVKQTLMQLRDPLRRRILKSQREEMEAEEEAERIKNKASIVYGLPRQPKSRQGRANANKHISTNKTEALVIIGGATSKTTNKTTDKPHNNNCSKLFYKRKMQEGNENVTLPAITSSNQCNNKLVTESSSESHSRPETLLSQKGTCKQRLTVLRASPKLPGQSLSDQDNINTINEVKDDRRPETSMTGALRRRSLTFPQPSATSLGHRPRCEDFSQNEDTLTMEETLRIKGKFRQIGHSIIATALLKGLRQRGAATSEAIHNMHKPISVEPTTETDQKTTTSQTEEKEKSGLDKFRKLTRKAINGNTVVNLKSHNSSPVTTSKQDSTDKAPQRKLGLAGVANAVKLSQAIEKSETRRQLMDEQTQNRRRKIGIAGIAHAAMVTKALNNITQNNTKVMPKEEKTVRFDVEVWQ